MASVKDVFGAAGVPIDFEEIYARLGFLLLLLNQKKTNNIGNLCDVAVNDLL